jgi:hypothetical protein
MSDQPRKAVPSWNAFFEAKKMFPDKLHLNLLAGNTQNGGGGTASDRPLRRGIAVI